MKRDFSPVYLALVLVLGSVVLRLLGNHYLEALPNVSPLMALAYVGAMYFPRRWGWLLGPVALLLTDVAFLGMDRSASGTAHLVTVWTVVGFLSGAMVYVGASAFGQWIARSKSLGRILGGSVLCSLVFYVVANSFAWFDDSFFTHLPGGYAPTLAGWWQANTTGIPGYDPTWMFLRNGMAGDLFFALVLLLVLDRALLFGTSATKAAPRMA